MSSSIKERIVRASLSKAQKRVEQIKVLLDAKPLQGIIEVRKKAAELFRSMPYGSPSPEVLAEIKELAAEERRLFEIAELQQNTVELINERVNLECEISELSGELYFIEHKKQGRV